MRYKEKKLVYWNLIITISITLLLVWFSLTGVFKEIEFKKGITGMAVSTQADEGYTIQELQQEFDAYPFQIVTIHNCSYNAEPFIHGQLSMYEATQNTTYLEYALENVENTIERMVDIDGDGYLEWIGYNGSNWDHDGNLSTPNMTSCLYHERGAKSFSRLARVIKNDKILDEKYGVRADEIIKVVKNILEHPNCTYRNNENSTTVQHIISHRAIAYLELYLIEGNETYLNYATMRADQMKGAMFSHPDVRDAWLWASTACKDLNFTYPYCYDNYLDGGAKCTDSKGHGWCSPSDVSHSTDTVFSIIELYRAGIVFTKEDVNKVLNTFLYSVWDGNMSYPFFYSFIDGHNAADVKGRAVMGQGWAELGSFNLSIHDIFKARIESDPDLIKGGRINQVAFYGSLARNLVVGDCQYTNNAKEICDSIDNDCDGLVDENLNCSTQQENLTCEFQGYTCVSGTCNGTIMNYNCTDTSKICCNRTIVREQTCAQKGGIICASDKNCNGAITSANDTNECCLGNCITEAIIRDKTCLEQSGKICNATQYCTGAIGVARDGECCLGECIAGSGIEECKAKGGSCKETCLTNETQLAYYCGAGICCGEEEKPEKNWFYWFIGGIGAAIVGVIGYIIYEVNKKKEWWNY